MPHSFHVLIKFPIYEGYTDKNIICYKLDSFIHNLKITNKIKTQSIYIYCKIIFSSVNLLKILF